MGAGAVAVAGVLLHSLGLSMDEGEFPHRQGGLGRASFRSRGADKGLCGGGKRVLIDRPGDEGAEDLGGR